MSFFIRGLYSPRGHDGAPQNRIGGMPEIILASTSRYRRALLERLRVRFVAVSPGTDESVQDGELPAATAGRLAGEKARAVAQNRPDAIVIGSDQVMEAGGQALGKPGTLDALRATLRSLSGSEFSLHTAVCVVGPGDAGVEEEVLTYRGRIRDLRLEEIDRYRAKEPAVDCAGGMKVEGLGVSLLESLQGEDPTGVIGLPLAFVAGALRRFGAFARE